MAYATGRYRDRRKMPTAIGLQRRQRAKEIEPTLSKGSPQGAHFVGGYGTAMGAGSGAQKACRTTADFRAQSQKGGGCKAESLAVSLDAGDEARRRGDGRFRDFWPNPHRLRTEKTVAPRPRRFAQVPMLRILNAAVRWRSGRRRRFAKAATDY